jgi:Zn-dependent protease
VTLTPSETSNACKRCTAPLPLGAVVCKECHALVHAEELDRLSANAQSLEATGNLTKAKDEWLKALPLLPGESKQALWIQEHARRLDLAVQVSPNPKARKSSWGRFAPLAPILLALSKGKALLALLNLKFLLSLGAFIGVYWSLYGIRFGLGFAVLILVHEMGHYIDIKRRGLPADMPVFLPGLGAFVRWQALGVPVTTRAAVSLAGPLAGFFGALACAFLWFQTGDPLWAALARAGSWLNLLNLIPVWGLDGGHAFYALAKRDRIIVLTVSIGALVLAGESVFLLIALGAGWRLFTKDLPEQSSPATTAYFVVLLAALAVLMAMLPGHGFAS